ncbi:MAG: ATP-binding protein [Candidatus Limisoma sp.]
MIINRDSYLNQLISGKGNGLIKIITGIRRCGKSFLLNNLFYKHLIESNVPDNHIVRIAFDDWELRELCDPARFMEHLRSRISDDATYYLLLDEVQLLGDFVPVLNGLLRRENLDIYVTGSNSRFLSSDVVTEFRGRGDQVHIYPLSFSEFMSVDSRHPLDAWTDYYTYGGLPHVLMLDTDKKKADYLKNLAKTVYIADIIERHHIKHVDEFVELLSVVASAIGSPTNPRKIADTFKSVKKISISQPTVSKYLGYLQDAFITERSMRYNIKGRKYINTLAKYYFSDMGLRNAILGFRQQEENHIMENIIYNELRSRGYSVDVGVVEHRAANVDGKIVRKQYEVDFVANQGSERYYIQSAFVMPTDAKERQESQSLVNISDSFKKIIIVKDYIKPKRNEQGILTISLFDFLLKPDAFSW